MRSLRGAVSGNRAGAFFLGWQNLLSAEPSRGIVCCHARYATTARLSSKGVPEQLQLLSVLRQECPECGESLHWRYENRHTVVTLQGMLGLRMRISRCENPSCERYHQPYRSEAEGAIVLPQHEFGLDVLALVGALR